MKTEQNVNEPLPASDLFAALSASTDIGQKLLRDAHRLISERDKARADSEKLADALRRSTCYCAAAKANSMDEEYVPECFRCDALRHHAAANAKGD